MFAGGVNEVDVTKSRESKDGILAGAEEPVKTPEFTLTFNLALYCVFCPPLNTDAENSIGAT